MAQPARESWITFASNASEVTKAILLARSLKFVHTRRMIGVIVSSNIPQELRSLLQKEFCLVRELSQEDNKILESECAEFSAQAWIEATKMNSFDKLIFLDSGLLVLKYCDNLFRNGIRVYLGNNPTNKTPLVSVIVPRITRKSMSKFKTSGKTTLVTYNQLGFKIMEFPNDDYLLELSFEDKHCFSGNLHDTHIIGIKDTDFTDFWTWNSKLKLNNPSESAKSILKHCELLMAENLPETGTRHLSDSIAIVGMAFRLPGASNLEEFWTLLSEGKEGIIKVPDHRWNSKNIGRSIDNHRLTEAGFLTCPVDEIDSKFFNLSTKEVEMMDPQIRLTLRVMHESLEHAGISPPSLKGTSTGVFGGWWRNDYKEMLQECGHIGGSDFLRTYMGNTLGAITSRISHFLETTGPSVSTESGCSTSIVSVDSACKSLELEECDLALAFGVNLFLHPFFIAESNSIVASDGRCKTFDIKADGFGRAEGCTFLVLKRYPDALKDNDKIWGVIRGTAVVQDGLSSSQGTPTAQSEALAMQKALIKSRVDPSEVSFIETHGTGTAVGDPMEVEAINLAYGGAGRSEPLIIGSVKTNIGHTESCSGIAGIIKTVLCLQKNQIPPHLNFSQLNPDVNLKSIPARIPLKLEDWKTSEDSQATPKVAGVSSFGITGTNAHVILEQYDRKNLRYTQLAFPKNDCLNLLKLSANCVESLELMKTKWIEYLKYSSEEELTNICYTANVGRGDYSIRSIYIGRTKEALIASLSSKSKLSTLRGSCNPKLCFLFTGQGSQYVGMAEQLYENSPIFAGNFDHCHSFLLKKFQIDIRSVLWGESKDMINHTLFSQTGIFCVEYCLTKLLESWGIRPSCVAGHSLGEFAASVAAGILKLEDALLLVATRSHAINSLPESAMVVIKCNYKETVALLDQSGFTTDSKWLDIAAVNAEDQTVLAGTHENIQDFCQSLINNNIQYTLLDTTHAFHSRLMDPIENIYKKQTSKIEYQDAKCKYISGMLGKLMDEKLDSDYWLRHTRDQVRWVDASKTIIEEGKCDAVIEIGPHPVLSTLFLKNAETSNASQVPKCIFTLRKNKLDLETIYSCLSDLYSLGCTINWESFYQFSSCSKVTVPFYEFVSKQFDFIPSADSDILIHPLIGSRIPSPLETSIFKSSVSIEHRPYLKDHMVGNMIIYPGAGYLEMILVAGYAANQCLERRYTPPMNPITLTNFQIESPMVLELSEPNIFQTLVHEQDGQPKVSVYSRLDLDGLTSKWIRHATGSVSPFLQLSTEESQYFQSTTFGLAKERCSMEVSAGAKSYRDLKGIKFGKTFQTINAAWKSPTSEPKEMFFECIVTCPSDGYILHPVMIDAMFQALITTQRYTEEHISPELFVPVAVSKFIFHSNLSTNLCYLHCKEVHSEIAGSESVVGMFDSTGMRVATMIGAVLLQTDVNTIALQIQTQRVKLPKLVEESWKPVSSPLNQRANAIKESINEFAKITSGHDKDTQDYFYELSNRLYLHYTVKALRNMGIEMILLQNEFITISQITKILKVQTRFAPYLKILLSILERNDITEAKINSTEYSIKIKKTFPPVAEMNSEIQSLENTSVLKDNPEVVSVRQVCSAIPSILLGQESPLAVLFPDDTVGPAECFYKESPLNKIIAQSSDPLMMSQFGPLNESLDKARPKQVARILEIGAGTGSFTDIFKRYLPKDQTTIEYTYTDVSPMFLEKGAEIFKDTKVSTIYRLLNIEEDPLSQGFIHGYYDIIFASFVIHATRDIRETLRHIQMLLNPHGGLLLINELAKPLTSINLIFGSLDGFSRYSDFNLRPQHCELNVDSWISVMSELGLSHIRYKTCYFGHGITLGGYLMSRSEMLDSDSYFLSTSRKPVLSIVFSNNQSFISYFSSKLSTLPARHLLAIKTNGFEKLQTSTLNKRCYLAGINGNEPIALNTLMKEYLNDKFTLDKIYFLCGLEEPASISKVYEESVKPFLWLSKLLTSRSFNNTEITPQIIVATCLQRSELTGNVGQNPMHSIVCGMNKSLQNETTCVNCRCVDLNVNYNELTEKHLDVIYTESYIQDNEVSVAYNGFQRHVLRLGNYKQLVQSKPLSVPQNDRFCLALSPTNQISDIRFIQDSSSSVASDEVEIEVRAYSLNFRDVLTVLKPIKEFENIGGVGLDFAGVVTTVGNNVTTHVVGDRVFGFKVGEKSLPNYVVSKASHIVKIPEGNNSFEEVATLPAVLATAYDCLINVAKIKSQDTVLIHTGSGGVGLCAIQIAKNAGCRIVATAGSERKREYLRRFGVSLVFDSRTTEYSSEIRKALNGEGVDVVLNSLTSDGFKEATLEVCNTGARFVEMSKLNIWTKQEVECLRPDIFYEIVDLSASTPDQMKAHVKSVETYLLSHGSFKTLPYVLFSAEDIKGALTFLQKAKHVGKVICKMPKYSTIGTTAQWTTELYNDKSTYLITGGLGGIGIEICKWMISKGARNIVLVGRSSAKETAANVIKTLNSNPENNIIEYQCDIGDFKQCQTMLCDLFKSDQNIPPLKGIMHAAGVLADGSLDTQTWEMYEKVFNAKVNGGWNLHLLTENDPLQHFVMFSSVAAISGSLGQSNHCAANTFLDSLTHYRHSIGLPATTVNWGQWGEVGVAVNMEVSGIRPFTTLQALSAFELGLRNQSTHFGVFEGEFSQLTKLFYSTQKYLENLKSSEEVKKTSRFAIHEDVFWKNYNALTTPNEKQEYIKLNLRAMLRDILGMDPQEPFDDNTSFQDMGMDSLMMIELKNHMQGFLGNRVKISLPSLRDCKTVNQLSLRLTQIISDTEEIAPLSRDELRQLIREDSYLSPDIAPPNNYIIPLSEVSCVLLTGITGNFGPFVLKELCKRKHITKIYCLVRPSATQSAEDRLLQCLKEQKLDSSNVLDKVEAIAGNIVVENLGINQKRYLDLAQNVHCVFNIAASIELLSHYRKCTSAGQDSRSVNVLGTLNILRFCCAVKTKLLYHTSTYIASNAVTEHNQLSEDWPQLNEFDNMVNSGYPISKFIADLLISTAVERGLPCKVFRLPSICVHNVSQDKTKLLQNGLVFRCLSYMYVGAMPAAAVPMTILSGDTCAEISIAVFFNENSRYEIYNVLNPYANDEQEIEELAAEFGFTVEIVEPDEFIKRVENIQDSHMAHTVKTLLRRNEDRQLMEEHIPAIGKAWLVKKDMFFSRKLEQLIPGYHKDMKPSLYYLKKDLEFADKAGMFKYVGLTK